MNSINNFDNLLCPRSWGRCSACKECAQLAPGPGNLGGWGKQAHGIETLLLQVVWKIPIAACSDGTEGPGRLQSMGLQRVRHDLVTEHTHMHRLMGTTSSSRVHWGSFWLFSKGSLAGTVIRDKSKGCGGGKSRFLPFRDQLEVHRFHHIVHFSEMRYQSSWNWRPGSFPLPVL